MNMSTAVDQLLQAEEVMPSQDRLGQGASIAFVDCGK